MYISWYVLGRGSVVQELWAKGLGGGFAMGDRERRYEVEGRKILGRKGWEKGGHALDARKL